MEKVKKCKKVKDFFENLWFNITYYFYDVPTDFFYKVKWYFRNLITFQKTLWSYRDFDFSYLLDLNIFGLTNLQKCLEKGHEVDVTRLKKVDKIGELIKLLNDLKNEEGIFESHIKEGETFNNYAERVNKQYIKGFDRIAKIVKGQNIAKASKEKDDFVYEEYFDGSGILGWWD